MGQMNRLQVTNWVLKRMRLPTVTTVNSNIQSSLIGDFLGEVEMEVYRSHAWSNSNLTGYQSSVLINGASGFTIEGMSPDTAVKDLIIYSGSTVYSRPTFLPLDKFQEKSFTGSLGGVIQYYTVDTAGTVTADQNFTVLLFPANSSGGTLLARTLLVRVPDTISVTSSVDTDSVFNPWLAVAYGTLWRAKEERGDPPEEVQTAYKRYRSELAESIARDAERQPGLYDWKPV